MSTVEEEKTLSTAGDANGDPSEGIHRAQLSGGDIAGIGNLDKIRNILFGTQMRDYEKRFARLEDRIIKVSTEMREEMRKSLEALETYVKREQGQREKIKD